MPTPFSPQMIIVPTINFTDKPALLDQIRTKVYMMTDLCEYVYVYSCIHFFLSQYLYSFAFLSHE